MPFTVCDYERNGYHDSDFYEVLWTPGEGFRTSMIGTTAGAGGRYVADLQTNPRIPAEMVSQFVEEFARTIIFPVMRCVEDRSILEPDRVEPGQRVTLLASGSFTDKRTGVRVEYTTGDCGTVFFAKAFGTFYRNGYNRPGRHNIRCGVELDDGRRIFVALKRLRLEPAPRSNAEILDRAIWAATFDDPARWFGGAWSSAVYVDRTPMRDEVTA